MNKKQADMCIVIEKHINHSHRPDNIILFGPFETEIKAADFCNRRIQLLASEWVAEEDGILTDNITWKVDRLLPIS